jgi:tRNA dimethylallyltransferase
MSWNRTRGRSFQPLSSRFSHIRSDIDRNRKPPRIVVIFGPTAVGKSETLEALDGSRFEVINADSMQAYRHMDVGTAKPPAELLARLPHHLVSIIEPSTQYNAGEFVTRAQSLVPEIRARGKTPVICGGTAFYIRSFLCGLPESPPGSADVRARLRLREREGGHPALYQELAREDPEAAKRIQPNDRYRIMRALEILETSGRSQFSYSWPRALRSDLRFLIIGLERPREQLYARIDARVEEMFRAGLVEEVRRLMAMGFVAEDPGMQAIGYREFFTMQKGCLSLSDVKQEIQRNSRRFAKRQLTFFRSVPGVQWRDPAHAGEIRSLMETFLDSNDEAPEAVSKGT